MRIRAGIVLIENDKVVLIERFRSRVHYYVFPGGGVEEGERPEVAALREMKEETGLTVRILKRVMTIFFGLSIQHYFLAERVDGKYGTGTGEEFTDADPDDSYKGVYVPVWMPLNWLEEHAKVYPVSLKELVINSVKNGWPDEPVMVDESGGERK